MTSLSVFQVQGRVAIIKSLSTHDVESAHLNEDDLYFKVLSAIADGAPNAVELAKAALETDKLDFPRYCA